jgi:hypothetical protein
MMVVNKINSLLYTQKGRWKQTPFRFSEGGEEKKIEELLDVMGREDTGKLYRRDKLILVARFKFNQRNSIYQSWSKK